MIKWRKETNAKHLDKIVMDRFNDFIQRNLLIDPPFSNNSFIRSNLIILPTLSRPDRFLYTSLWEKHNNQHTSKTLVKAVSDHFPIVLEFIQIKWGSCPFRLYNSSLGHPEFKRNIKLWWESSKQNGKIGFQFIQRLKMLAKDIKLWHNRNHSSQTEARKTLITEINQIDKLEATSNMTKMLHSKRLALK